MTPADIAALREKAENRACGPCLGEGVIIRSPRKPDTCTSCNGTGKRPDATTIALIDRVEELERERDEARNRVLRPLTEREVQAALHEGRAEAMAATGDNAWTSLLTARDKLAAECERLRALVNRAADSLDYCVQRHGEHSKSVRGDELRLAAIASEGGGEVSDEKTLDNKQLDMLRMIADTHHRTECASWKLLWLIDQHRALSTALATATAERDALRGEVERLRLAADMLREIPRAALSADKVYREDWEELFTDEDGAALYLDTAVDRVLDRITRKEPK